MEKRKIGQKGEEQARKYLEEKGYKILAKNYLKRSGEIDLIAYDPVEDEYVFIEVKTRSNLNFGYPEEAIDENKLNKIVTTAEQWFDEEEINNPEWRIDIIAVEDNARKITHLKNISLD